LHIVNELHNNKFLKLHLQLCLWNLCEWKHRKVIWYSTGLQNSLLRCQKP